MGRGLSELQKTMLTMQPDEYNKIYVRDVITKHYGWVQHEPYRLFSKKEIGPKKYISAYIAVRKSLKRLKDRGLIWSPGGRANHARYELTQAGEEMAKLISAKVEPEACSIADRISDKDEALFKKEVEEIYALLPSYDAMQKICGGPVVDVYFALKEACELRLNTYAGSINECVGCAGLRGPVPVYPDAGKNFEIRESLKSKIDLLQ